MSVPVTVYIEDIDSAIASYDRINLYRSFVSTDYPILDLPVATATLVAAQEQYTLTDLNGTADYGYRYTLYNSVSTDETDQSAWIEPGGVTLLRLVLEAAKYARRGFASVASQVGAANSLIDATLGDDGADEHFLEGNWIYRPDAAAADQLRRVQLSGFTTTPPAAVTPSRAWTNPPAQGETYHVYSLFPPFESGSQPYSWAMAARDALDNLYYVDQVNLGEGPALSGTTYRVSLDAFVGQVRRDDVRRVYGRTTDANGNVTDRDWDTSGYYWQAIEDGPGSVTLELYPAPGTDTTVIVEVSRTYDPMYAPADVLSGPLKLARLATIAKVYAQANETFDGRYQKQAESSRLAFLKEAARWKPKTMLRGI